MKIAIVAMYFNFIKLIDEFSKSKKFKINDIYGEKTNRIIKLKKLIKKKIINKKLRFLNN